jgi:hypothetical protein
MVPGVFEQTDYEGGSFIWTIVDPRPPWIVYELTILNTGQG